MTALAIRLASLEVDSHSDRSTVSVPALQILGHLAERHFVAIVGRLERLDADAGELLRLEETLEALEGEASAQSNRDRA